MVMRRGDARHKDVPDPLDAGPKRITTIHAQRKFAQGSGMNSPVMSPIKEKEKAKVNGGAADCSPSTSPSTSGAPAKRPRTEDFITFLCYRGTPYLPSGLSHFNVPSKPDKNERDAPSSSKQTASPSRQQEKDKDDKLKRAKQNKRIAMQSKSKVFDQRQRKSRLNTIAKQGKVLKSKAQTPISKDRLKKAAAASVTTGRGKLKGRPPVVRASHPAILKRLGASRARAGLRSGGQPPSGAEVGTRTDRKSEEKVSKNKSKVPPPTKTRGKIALPSRIQGKRGTKAAATPSALKLRRGKVLKETPKGKAHPKSLNLAARPSRKTKEAAALYMEMITKDLRSPDEDDDMSPLVGPRDVDFHLTPVKTRTRSGTIEDSSPPSASSLKKSAKANTPSSPGLSQTPSVRRSLKVSSGQTLKRTRGVFKDDESNTDTPKGSPVRGRPSRKSANDEAQSSSIASQRGGSTAKKSLRKSKVEENDEMDESSHSEEEEEEKSSLPAAKKAKKGNASPKVDKPVAPKKPNQKNAVTEVPKKATKVHEKSARVSDAESEQNRRRPTRSSGPNTQETDEDLEKDIKPVARKGKSRGPSVKNKSSSESESEEVKDSTRKKLISKKTKPIVKKEAFDSGRETEPSDTLPKSTRQGRSSVKVQESAEDGKPSSQRQARTSTGKFAKIAKPTAGESESGEDDELQPKTARSSTRSSRAGAKTQENPDDNEKPGNQRPSRSAKVAKDVKTEKSDSENEEDPVPARRPGRPRKVVTDEPTKPSETQEKRTTRKSQPVDDSSKKRDVKTVKNEDQLKKEESEASESESEDRSAPRTRMSKLVDSVESDVSKTVPKPKRLRVTGAQMGKAKEDSENEDVSNKKPKQGPKPEKKVDSSEPEERDVRRSLSAKQLASKSDVEKEETPKILKKVKEALKTESGGESDKEGKSIKACKKPSKDDADQETSLKAVVKSATKPVVKVESKEEAAPKRTSRSGPATPIEFDVKVPANKVIPSDKDEKDVPMPAKRGRKPKQVQESSAPAEIDVDHKPNKTGEEIVEKEPAKRGRKPKLSDVDKVEGRSTRKSAGADFEAETSESKKETDIKEEGQRKKSLKKADTKGPEKAAKADSEAPQPAKRGRKPKKVDASEESDKDRPVRSGRKMKKLVDSEESEEEKPARRGRPKKVRESEEESDEGKPARRGRKPKKVEESEESVEEKPVGRSTRPRRSTRTAIKRESYSEFSGEEVEDTDDDYEDDFDSVTRRKTRGRKSNVKYTEKESDESLSAGSETEQRPRRSRRSVFSTTLAIDLESDVDDDFLEEIPPAKSKKSIPESDIPLETPKEAEEQRKSMTQKETKPQPRKLPLKGDEKTLSNGTESKNTVQAGAFETPRANDEASFASTEGPASKTPVSFPEKTPVPATNAAGAKDLLKPAPRTGVDHPEKLDKDKLSLERKSDNVEQQNIIVGSVDVQQGVPEVKRMTRRLSRDKPEIIEPVRFEVKPDQTNLSVKQAPQQTLSETFDLGAPSKDYDNNNGLAILSDVAFSELQNRKNIMDRKLSSDSATSFSWDEVPTLPVRKDKVLPKAKADLPTVREKTESDEDLSGELDSPYEEYGKSDKSRRKRLPKRIRREPTRQVSQRPVRNRRVKLASYIDDESFSSDRSSSPEMPIKPVQKKRKSEDKPVEMSVPLPAPKSVIPVSSPPMISSAAPTVPSVSVPKTPKESFSTPKPKETKPPIPQKVETPKVSNVQRNDDMKKPLPKPNIPTDPILTIPRPPQLVKEVAKAKNDTITLFSGVSGAQVTMSETRLTPVQPHREVAPQIGQVKRPNPEPLAKPPPYVPSRPAVGSSHSFSKSSLFNVKATPDYVVSSEVKAKPSNLDTWKNAFINAKIPKPGQLSPAHHSSAGTPFMRKSFSNSPKTPTKPEDKPTAFVPTKLPGVQTFKTSAFQNLGKLGNQSPSRMPGGMSPGRPPVSALVEPKPHVYLSPSRVKNSPSKDEKIEPKKPAEIPKSLTLLQYEKRSQEVVSSLKGSQPVLLDGVQSYVPAFPTKLKEYSMEKAKIAQARQPPVQIPEETAKAESGKHTNLPFAVDSALRKRSPITVKKPVKVPEKKAVPTITIPEVSSAPSVVPRLAEPSTSATTNPTAKLELLSKKKVQMTNEEIKKWLDDSTSTGVEHAKDCGIFENNQCECSYRTSGESMLNSSVGTIKEDPKIDHGVVEPPIQLKELDSGAKFTAETISTCKVEDYKEKLLLKSPTPQTLEAGKELIPPGVPKPKKPVNLTVEKAKRKTSMTEDEMCEYGFRFERNAHSSRESGSDMSSPTPRDDVSSSNEEKFDGSPGERKSIFLQRRQKSPAAAPPPRKQLSKSPCAFSAENESSVYAFEDAPPPAVNNPFRRRGSRHKSSEDDGPASSSIAVQVNLESSAAGDSEQVLECSTQTEQVDNEGQLFYFPLEGDSHPQEVIQGVQVKLQSSEGPEQKVIMKAKLVTKPSTSSSKPVRPLGDAGRAPQRPEQKVRPLATTSTSTQSRPPVGTVTPTVREQPSSSTSVNSQGTATDDRPELTNQSTQAAAVPQVLGMPLLQQPTPTPDPVKPEPSPLASTPKPSPKSTPATSAPRRSSPNEFPLPGTTPRMVEALTFYPSEKEFQDPLEYIERITPQAQTFGICRIVPPSSFKPECKVSDDMRFTAYNQYVHKMLYRWGPNVREMTAIKKYLATQSIALKQPPYIGGMEIDLPRLYQTVQSCGGLKEVIEKKRWAKVADMMKIPKAAQDRVTKLDDLYCKFLLPYDTLSHAERSKLLEEVDMEWTERERRIALEAERESKGEKEEKEENSDSEDESDDGRDECITKGKTMPLSGFYRVARNTMAMWFKEPNPSSKEVENEYWKQVTSRKQHVCVNSGSIDSGSYGYGFPTSKSSSTSRHPWNLKVLTNNQGSILRSMGPVMGVTVPTLHVGMLFSACCWYRDPHGLPWIEYLHTGANKIWYAVPDLWNEELHGAMRTILPRYCQDKPIWLASDTAMVPPDLLVQQGVSLCRAVQEPGQFILVFPKAFTSTICTGYIVSESVYFAQPSWLNNAKQIFKDIQESCEPPVFSLERLLFNIATDARSTAEVLTQVLPMIIELRDTELRYREQLRELGVTGTERLAVSKGGRKRSQEEPEEYECELCRGNLYLSLVTNTVEEANFCLLHAVETLTKDRSHVKNCKLMYSYDEEEMNEVLDKIKQRIEAKTVKKQNNKTGGSSRS